VLVSRPLIILVALLCETTEICKLPEEVEQCRGYFPHFYFNVGTGDCKVFIYGRCARNKNNFQSCFPVDCQIFVLPCILESEHNIFLCDDLLGFLKRDRLSYFLLFTFSLPSREMYTSSKNRIMHNSCFLYFFLDTVTGTCVMFVYSGCEGSENNFFTSDECQKECKRKIRNFWNLSSIPESKFSWTKLFERMNFPPRTIYIRDTYGQQTF
uniref:BPTI/Kunitz inhibitor domain-containing protein n=1 Tax=Laticauda laticaudata TaxID=8630 RepID=A0A8C5SJN8_LATLA